MNLTQMISELRAERESINTAIAAIERLVRSLPGRRGRPPAWLSAAKAAPEPGKVRPKRVVSAATKKKMAAAQQKRWAAKRKAQAQAQEA